MSRATIVVCCLLMGCAVETSEDEMPPSTPNQTAAALFAAIEQNEWTTAASYVDSAGAAAIQQQTLALLVARIAHRDVATRGTGGLPFEYELDPGSLARYGAVRVSPLRGKHTVGDVAALPAREFIAGAIEITQQFVGQGGATTQAESRRVERQELVDDRVAVVTYTPVERTGSEAASDEGVLRLRKRGRQWYVVPNGDIASPMLVVLRLVEGIGQR